MMIYVGATLTLLASGVALYALARVPRLRSAPTWLRLIAGNVLVFVYLVAVLFILAESYYRFLYDTTDSFSETRVSQQWFKRHYHRNNVGVRDDEDYSFSRRSRRPRVTFIGDSFTAGHGVARVEDRFGNRVRSLKHGEWEVHVYGELGRDTGAELKLIDDLASLRYDFDRVVLVYCLNDIGDIFSKPPPSPRPEQNSLVRSSFLINTLYFQCKARRDPELANYYGYLRDAYEDETFETQKERLTEFRDKCRDLRCRPAVVIFPFMHSLGANYDFRTAHERLREFIDEIDVPCLDLLATFESHAGERLTVNRFDAHPNERAHVLAADAILPWLESLK